MATPLPTVAGAAITPRGDPDAALGAVAVPAEAPVQARSDAHLLELWLFGKSPHTRRAYRRVTGGFFVPTCDDHYLIERPQPLAAASI